MFERNSELIEWEIEGPDLSARIPERKGIDAVLDLVGNTNIHGFSCHAAAGWPYVAWAGWLGGLDPVNNFNPLLQDAERSLLHIFWQLCIRHTRLSSLGTVSASIYRGI